MYTTNNPSVSLKNKKRRKKMRNEALICHRCGEVIADVDSVSSFTEIKRLPNYGGQHDYYNYCKQCLDLVKGVIQLLTGRC